MPVKYMARSSRGCGTRVLGGLYLFCQINDVAGCPNLPLPLPEICPCCGEGPKFSRGIKYITPDTFLPSVDSPCTPPCPICFPPNHGGLMWVGNMYYTPKQFIAEAMEIGISKRIAIKPKNLKPGDWIYFVHPAAIRVGNAVFDDEDAPRRSKHSHTEPGIFLSARLTEIQKIITEDQANDPKFVKSLEDNGIVPVVEYDDTQESIIGKTKKPKQGKKRSKK